MRLIEDHVDKMRMWETLWAGFVDRVGLAHIFGVWMAGNGGGVVAGEEEGVGEARFFRSFGVYRKGLTLRLLFN